MSVKNDLEAVLPTSSVLKDPVALEKLADDIGNLAGLTIGDNLSLVGGTLNTSLTPTFTSIWGGGTASSSTNRPCFDVTRTQTGAIADHAYDDSTTYNLTTNSGLIGAATFANKVTINLNGFEMPHFINFEANAGITVNGATGTLDTCGGMTVSTPGGVGAIGCCYGVQVSDFAGRGTGSGFAGGNVAFWAAAGNAYSHPTMDSWLGRVLVGSWAPQFETGTTSPLWVGQPWTLGGAAAGSTWPGVLCVGRGAVTSGGATPQGNFAIDTGARIGGAYYYKTADALSLALGGSIDFLKTDATTAHAGGYISIKTNDNASDAPTSLTEHLRISSTGVTVTGDVTIASTTLLKTSMALTDGHGASTATLTNAPAAGNPTKWVAINDNGTTRYIPTW